MARLFDSGSRVMERSSSRTWARALSASSFSLRAWMRMSCRKRSAGLLVMLPRLSLLVLIRTLHPEEGLDVDHVPRLQIAKIVPHDLGKLKEVGVGLPGWPGPVYKVEAILARCRAGDVRLQKDVRVRLGNESEDGDYRPSEDARLYPGQSFDDLAP